MAAKVAKQAGEYLDRLLTDPASPLPSGVDEQSSQWADDFLAAIRSYRLRHPDQEARRSARRFGLALAKDRYRCFWEFWQNAEDARSSSLRFLIRERELVIENDGLPFTSRDIYSVCFVASSQKTGSIGQMGQFGIGLLSLMKLAPAPELHSGPFHFRLERDYTYPETLSASGPIAGTRITASLSDNIDHEELRDVLFERLMENEEVLLYMQHLRSVEVTDVRSGETRRIESKVEVSATHPNAVRLGRNRWLPFAVEIKPIPGLTRDDEEPVPEKLRIVLVRTNTDVGSHKVASFFPTTVYTTCHGVFPLRLR